MKKRLHIHTVTAGLAALALLAGCTAVPDSENGALNSAVAAPDEAWRVDFSAARFRADVEFLADDLLAGRDTGTEGYQIAANYVASEFKKLGLTPKGDNGTYFQTVPFRSVKLDMDQSAVRIINGDKEKSLAISEEFFMTSNPHVPDMEISGDVVFAGYGVYAPELGVDELSGLDLEGKIVALFGGAPKSLNSEVQAHYGSTLGKAKALLERGAVGIVIIPDAQTGETWNPARYKAFMLGNQISWVASEGTDVSVSGRLSVLVNSDAAEMLFEGAEKSYAEVLADHEAGTMTGFALNSRLDAKRDSIILDPIESPNVVAVFEGSDPVLKNEYVVLSAHLDHVGVGHNLQNEDHIFNGAMDNATGIATMLEVARNLGKTGAMPRRSILFTAVTAEEKGLLGAEYFAHYPTVPEGSMVANVNLDMPVLLYDFADVIAFGAERSSLGPITEQALAKIGVTLTPDPLPEEGLFTRSDHYRFVQQGIPSVFLMTGFADTVDGENGGEIFTSFLSTTYHTPADEPSLPIRWDVGAKFSYVNYLILTAVANADERPAWNEGDFFGNLYGR